MCANRIQIKLKLKIQPKQRKIVDEIEKNGICSHIPHQNTSHVHVLIIIFFCLWLTLFPQRPISNPYYQTKLWIFFLLFSNQLIFFESCTKPNRVDTFDWTIFAHLLIIHLKSIWLVQKLFTFRINYYKEREKMMQKWSNICQKIYFWNGFLFEYVYIYMSVCSIVQVDNIK